jgi:hypothetical protein
VRAELPTEAEPPVVEIQRADRPYASFYLSFTSTDRDVPAVTDWLVRIASEPDHVGMLQLPEGARITASLTSA